MFQRTIYSSFLLTALALAAIYLFHVKIQPEQIFTFQKMMEKSQQLRSQDALEREPLHQFRKAVQKDIWIPERTDRLHLRLKSAQSELILSQKKGKIEAKEKLEEIDCWIQDKINAELSLQQIKTLSAKEGIYYFPSHRFLAQSVSLAFFRLSGTDLPLFFSKEKPFLTGTANEVNFAADAQPLTLSAHGLKANFHLRENSL